MKCENELAFTFEKINNKWFVQAGKYGFFANFKGKNMGFAKHKIANDLSESIYFGGSTIEIMDDTLNIFSSSLAEIKKEQDNFVLQIVNSTGLITEYKLGHKDGVYDRDQSGNYISIEGIPINIELKGNKYSIKCSKKLSSDPNADFNNCTLNRTYTLNITNNRFQLVTLIQPYKEKEQSFNLADRDEWTIGLKGMANENNMDIILNNGNNYVRAVDSVNNLDFTFKIYKKSDKWYLVAGKTGHYASYNGKFVGKKEVELSDNVFIYLGSVYFYMDGKYLKIYSNYNTVINNAKSAPKKEYKEKEVKTKASTLPQRTPLNLDVADVSDEFIENFEYPYMFKKSPREREKFKEQTLEIQQPPSIGSKPTIIWSQVIVSPILTVLVMAIAGFFVLGSTSMVVMTLPMTLIGVGMSIWRYKAQKKKYLSDRDLQIAKYSNYIHEQDARLDVLENEQRNALVKDFPSISDCIKSVESLDRTLWKKRSSDDDYMKVRLGLGTIKSKVKINVDKERLKLIEDELEHRPTEMYKKHENVKDCPICIDMYKHAGCGIIGDRDKAIKLAKNMIVQLTSFYDYVDLKVVVICDKEEYEEFKFTRWLPHVYYITRIHH